MRFASYARKLILISAVGAAALLLVAQQKRQVNDAFTQIQQQVRRRLGFL